MSTISAGTTTNSSLVQTGDTTGKLVFQTNGTTTVFTLSATGAMGVGTTPSYGTSGQVLTSAGSSSVPTWTTLDALPSQTGNSGKYLTTDGTVASWATVVSGAQGYVTQTSMNVTLLNAGSNAGYGLI